MYRFIEQTCPTLLVDETDAFLEGKNETRGIINSCFDRGEQSALRTEEVDGEFKVKRFGAWCPKVFAGIGEALHPTTADRSITITMKRKKPSDKVARLRRRDCAAHFDAVKEMLCRWAQDNMDRLKSADPALPAELHDRAADKWEPLLAIADLAGGQWPKRARNVAVILSGGSADGEEETIGVQLLADLRSILGTADAILTKPLIDRLVAMDERPWGEFGKARKPINSHRLGAMLRPFGIVSEQITVDGVRGKGYTAAICRDVFDRYFPQAPQTPVQSSQAPESASIKDFTAVSEACTAPPVQALKSDKKTHEHSTLQACKLQKGVSAAVGEHADDIGAIPAFLDRRMPAAVVADDDGDGWEARP
jgi:putative DNA primase/helicase